MKADRHQLKNVKNGAWIVGFMTISIQPTVFWNPSGSTAEEHLKARQAQEKHVQQTFKGISHNLQ